eukprot:gene118-1163_t
MDSDLEAFSPHVPYWRVNNPTLWDFCVSMIGRADIEGSKSNVAMNAWLPQASYPCASFSPFGPHEISVLIELTLGHLRYHLTDVPPQPNSLPDTVLQNTSATRKDDLNSKTSRNDSEHNGGKSRRTLLVRRSSPCTNPLSTGGVRQLLLSSKLKTRTPAANLGDLMRLWVRPDVRTQLSIGFSRAVESAPDTS